MSDREAETELMEHHIYELCWLCICYNIYCTCSVFLLLLLLSVSILKHAEISSTCKIEQWQRQHNETHAIITTLRLDRNCKQWLRHLNRRKTKIHTSPSLWKKAADDFNFSIQIKFFICQNKIMMAMTVQHMKLNCCQIIYDNFHAGINQIFKRIIFVTN